MLNSLKPGQRIQDKFGVISVTEKTTSKGDPYWVVELTHPSGTISGKVWSDAMGNVEIKEGKVVELEAVVDNYRGANNFNILHASEILEDELENYLTETPTLVFDIETVGKSFKELDKTDQDYLVNNLEKNFDGTKEQLYDRTGLYPIWATVVTIGMMNPGTGKGAVYYIGKIKNHTPTGGLKIKNKDNFSYKDFGDEKALLEGFWETATKYQRFVTYNGSGFDWPFLMLRSGVHRIKVPFELKGDTDKFLDLANKLRMNYRSFKLEQVCKMLGVDNPKEAGISGMEVAKLYRKGKIKEILEYVSRDVTSTAELYKVWKTYLAGKVVV